MSEYVDVRTQAELDEALEREGVIPVCRGDGHFTAGDSATVRAWGSATVRAGGSATVEAGDSATVRAGGSATVGAWGSATVEAWGSATVRAGDSATVRASKYVAVHRPANSKAKVTGGVLIQLPKITTAEEWCDFYGAEVKRGIATLYKAVDDEFKSGYGFDYSPGSKPQAPDWDGGKAECGGGLHFCARPAHALGYAPGATRFVACPVRVRDIVVHPDAQMPNKVKARGVCKPVFEVDVTGGRL